MDDNVDDYDFAPSSSSNLASLFGNSSPHSETASLTYTAPKQPKPGNNSDVKNETPKVESSVFCARVVHVWKLTDGKYQLLGKHGLAVIGSTAQNSYEIILYKEQRNVIMRAKISARFEVNLKKDEFASLYDNMQENWLIKFNNNDDCMAVMNVIEKFGGVVNPIVPNVPASEKQDLKNTEELATPENKAKADILSRIAKMGQSILPSKDLDTDNESVESTDYTVSSCAPKPSFKENQHVSSTSAVIQPSQQIQNVPNTFVMSHPMVYDPLNLFYAENRAHNSEVRINLSQISDKLNQIISLVDSDKSNDNSNNLKSKLKVLELRNENLLRELGSSQEENAKLKLQLKEYHSSVKDEEQSKLELRLLEEQEAVKIEKLDKEIRTHKDEIAALTQIVEEQKEEIEVLKTNLELNQNNTSTALKDEISQLESTISDLKIKLQDYETKKATSREEFEDNKERSAKFIATLKDAMNSMYGNIMASCNEDQQNPEISRIIAQNIKSTTLKIIQNFQEEYVSLDRMK
ncbi:uncharacterized protein LOC123007281 [Tribolium madens]|uniref:uncharacterized protein LOC123007281 n=1 Tax=Tribolium madens TaxID=41895 RepID=UPI001CF74B00|nr:uncharacterized protein LOC123007281 [Tribolium madens]